MHKTLITAAIMLTTSVALPDVAAADEGDAASASKTTMVTDFRGRPPFKRRVVSQTEVIADQVSERDTTSDDDAGDRVQIVERRGAPPYKRRFVDNEALESAEFARFEETKDSKPTRRGPPGKMTSRR